ncbi:MAG: hypothetical protein ACE5OP_02595 [Candidatus Glassbacteria bacterium]
MKEQYHGKCCQEEKEKDQEAQTQKAYFQDEAQEEEEIKPFHGFSRLIT